MIYSMTKFLGPIELNENIYLNNLIFDIQIKIPTDILNTCLIIMLPKNERETKNGYIEIDSWLEKLQKDGFTAISILVINDSFSIVGTKQELTTKR